MSEQIEADAVMTVSGTDLVNIPGTNIGNSVTFRAKADGHLQVKMAETWGGRHLEITMTPEDAQRLLALLSGRR